MLHCIAIAATLLENEGACEEAVSLAYEVGGYEAGHTLEIHVRSFFSLIVVRYFFCIFLRLAAVACNDDREFVHAHHTGTQQRRGREQSRLVLSATVRAAPAQRDEVGSPSHRAMREGAPTEVTCNFEQLGSRGALVGHPSLAPVLPKGVVLWVRTAHPPQGY